MDYFLGLREREAMIDRPIDAKEYPAFYRKRERLELMDEHGVEATLMLPTLGVQVEHDIRHDIPTLYANVRSFNRWLEEDWGFGADGRIIGVPLMSLMDPDQAAEELERLLKAGARTFYLRPGPIYGRSPADLAYDRFWGLVNEAAIPVIFHIGDCDATSLELNSGAWGEKTNPPIHRMSPFQWYASHGDRPIMDTYAALLFHNLFGRFPKIRAVSIELGSTWVDWFLTAIDKAYRNTLDFKSAYGKLPAKPSEIFKEHIWITPYFEEDIVGLTKRIGVEHVLFGSDFPHSEGVERPIQFASRLEGMNGADVRKIMRTNSANLFGLAG